MAAFMVFLAIGPHLGLGAWEYPFRVVVLSAVLIVCSRHVIDLRVRRWGGSLAIGAAVFAMWIAPDVLWPSYRNSWLLQNALTSTVESSVPMEYRHIPMVLVSRALRAVVLVPIIEELFWRSWLMRWLIDADVTRVPLGTFTRFSFGVTAVLFALEHGAFWDVGLAAGVVYGWWMTKTRSLGDCIVAHAVTNALLSGYVVLGQHWQYW
jgi:CAAX prenyl protease-like protein